MATGCSTTAHFLPYLLLTEVFAAGRFIDYIGSWGPAICGHSVDEVNDALKAQIEKGTSFGAPCALEVRQSTLSQGPPPRCPKTCCSRGAAAVFASGWRPYAISAKQPCMFLTKWALVSGTNS